MECKQYEQTITGLTEGVISKETLLAHLQACSSYRMLYNAWAFAGEVIADEKSAQVSPFIHTRIMANVGKRGQGAHGWLQGVALARVALVWFALVAGLFGGWWVDGFYHDDGKQAVYIDYFYTDRMSIESGWLNNDFYEE